MRHRRRHQRRVAGANAPVRGGTACRTRQAVVRVQHGLGAAGGARRVENELDRVGRHALERRQRRLFLHQGRQVVGGAGFALHRPHVLQLRQPGPHALHHLQVVEAAETLRHEDGLGTAVGQDQLHLPVAVDRNDGTQHQPQPAGRQVDQHGFQPVGRLERQHVAGAQASCGQRRRQPAGTRPGLRRRSASQSPQTCVTAWGVRCASAWARSASVRSSHCPDAFHWLAWASSQRSW